MGAGGNPVLTKIVSKNGFDVVKVVTRLKRSRSRCLHVKTMQHPGVWNRMHTMNRRILARVIVTLFCIGLSSTRLSAQDWGDKMLDRLQIKFGNVARLADTTFTVRIKNPYV